MLNKETIKDVLDIAIPAVGEMILYMAIGVFDTMMVGRYGGQTYVSAVGLSTEILFTFFNIFIAIGISVGITSMVSRRMGSKKYDSAEEYASIGFFIGSIISLIICTVMFAFNKNILALAGADDIVINLGSPYMKIVLLGLFFNMLSNMMNGILRGYGNTKTPLYISLVVNVTNIGLDWVLIFGMFGFPELGIKGAAIATSTAHIMGFICSILYMMKKSRVKIRIKYIRSLNLHKLKGLIALTIPSSMQEGAYSISRLLSTFMVMHLGQTAFAANQIATTIESISFMPGTGFSIAATTLVGHKIGEKNYKKAKEYAYTCAFLGVIFMALCAGLFLIMPNTLISLFIKETEKEVIRLGASCLMIASIEQIPMGLSLILTGALKGSGDTKTPFMVSIFSSWFVRIPLMYYFIYILEMPVTYVWWITGIQWIIDGLIMFIVFKGKFKKKHL